MDDSSNIEVPIGGPMPADRVDKILDVVKWPGRKVGGIIPGSFGSTYRLVAGWVIIAVLVAVVIVIVWLIARSGKNTFVAGDQPHGVDRHAANRGGPIPTPPGVISLPAHMESAGGLRFSKFVRPVGNTDPLVRHADGGSLDEYMRAVENIGSTDGASPGVLPTDIAAAEDLDRYELVW